MIKWTAIDVLEIGSRLSVSDTSYFFDSPVVVDVAPRRYRVEVHVMSDEGFEYVGAVRVASGEHVTKGAQIGTVVIDFSQLGFCDRGAVEAVFGALRDEEMSFYYDQLDTDAIYGRVILPGHVKMAIVRTGYGDGVYPVFELLSASRERVGVEVDFVGSSAYG